MMMYKQLLVTALAFFSSTSVLATDGNCTTTIVDVVCDTDDTSTLCELITGSVFTVETLATETFTLFAPTNDAFASMDIELLDDLVNCTAAMNSIFAFHTVYGSSVYSTDLECGERITMANGDDSRTVCTGNKVYQKGQLNSREQMPEIVMADMEACNGVVHMVSEVMIPKEKYIAECEDEDETEVEVETPARNPVPEKDTSTVSNDVSEAECKTVAEYLCSDSDFSVICDLINEFQFYTLLSDCTSEWTVFAPTDEAFATFEEKVMVDLTAENLLDVLSFHAVQNSKLSYDDLLCTETIEMANGHDSRTQCSKDKETKEPFKIQKGAGQISGMPPKIIESDISACNGIIHVVDNVMIPPL